MESKTRSAIFGSLSPFTTHLKHLWEKIKLPSADVFYESNEENVPL